VALLLYNFGHSIWQALLTGAGAAVLLGVVGKMVTWSLAGAFGGYAPPAVQALLGAVAAGVGRRFSAP
jgi:hypothetical protein